MNPKVKQTLVWMLYITTDNINFGYLCHQLRSFKGHTARQALIAKLLTNRKIAQTAAALELYNAVLPAGWVWNFACREHQSPRIVNGTPAHVNSRCRSKVCKNFARGCIANDSEEMMATRYPRLPMSTATDVARYIDRKIIGGRAPLLD